LPWTTQLASVSVAGAPAVIVTVVVPQLVLPFLAVIVVLAAAVSSPYHSVAVPTPLVKVTFAVPPSVPV
jgi:hypothetical protein